MRKAAFVLALLLMPSLVMAQGTLQIQSVYGKVELKSVDAARFAPLGPSTQLVRMGDEVRTGPGGSLILELPDGSYMSVSENSVLTIQEFWSPGLRSLINLMMGKVRFYIQRLGGRPNPYRVGTPTALIAVRGTIFDVTVDDGQFTEIECLEGRVAIESVGLSDREVILDAGFKTLVRPGEYPLTPVGSGEELARNRVIRVLRKGTREPGLNETAMPGIEMLTRDNDRRNRSADPLQGSSTTSGEVNRAKPTIKWPPM